MKKRKCTNKPGFNMIMSGAAGTIIGVLASRICTVMDQMFDIPEQMNAHFVLCKK